MKKILFFLLSCALLALIQSQAAFAAEDKKDDDRLEPPPAVTFFQGRPVYTTDNETIKPPQVLIAPDPPPLKDFSAGKVVLWCVVGIDGKAHMIKVAKHLSIDADMKAVQNLKQWKFSVPVTKKDNQAVAVLMTVNVVWR